MKEIKKWFVIARVDESTRSRVAMEFDSREDAEAALARPEKTGFFKKQEKIGFGTVWVDSFGQFFYIVEGVKRILEEA